MPYIVSALALIAMAVGVALGTFRHRFYGVWSFFGILIAIAVTDVISEILSGSIQVATGGVEDPTVITLIIRVLLLTTLSALLSYYCENLLPVTPDPKTRKDNIIAGLLGFFNAFLIVGTIISYFRDYSAGLAVVDWVINRYMLLLLPWSMVAIVLFLIGWASIIKIRNAISSLRGTPAPAPSNITAPIQNQTDQYGGSSYGQPQSSGFGSSSYGQSQSSGFGSSSTAVQSAAVGAYASTSAYDTFAEPEPAEEEAPAPKQGFWAGIRQKLFERRPVEDTPADMPSNQASFDGYGIQPQSASGADTYGMTVSGATPPYGISTGAIAAAAPYTGYAGDQSDSGTTQSSMFGQSSSTTAGISYGQGSSYADTSSYGQSSGFGGTSQYGQQPVQYDQSSSGFGGTSQYGQQPAQYDQSSSGFGGTSQYGQQPAQYGQQPAQYGQQPAQYGQQSAQYGQQPAQYGQQPAQYGQQPAQYGQQPAQYGQQPAQYGQQPAQYGQQPAQYGQQPAQYGQQPAQYGQQPAVGGFGNSNPNASAYDDDDGYNDGEDDDYTYNNPPQPPSPFRG
jgi:hypothetical protein